MTSTGAASTRSRRPVARAVAGFAIAGLVALIGVTVATYVASRHMGTSIAVRDARRDTALIARTAIQPTLTNGLAHAEPAAVARMDAEVRSRVLDHNLVRVKIWRADGLIVYSDQHALIGSTYEVYQPVRTPDGRRLLFETYFRYDEVAADGHQVWNGFWPMTLVALLGLGALQIPLAWSMARRLRSGQERQELLLRRAIDASDAERRRIASDLHDGVVQDLASVSFSLAAVKPKPDSRSRDALRDAAAGTRRSIKALRSLLVEIYPPSLREAGLRAALSDLASPLSAHGIEARVDMPDDISYPSDTEAVLYRAAQEAVRNVVAHADAQHLDITLSRPDHRAVLDVTDDGVGFDLATLPDRVRDGHVGLRVLSDLVADAGGRVAVVSRPDFGTSIHVEVPIQ